MVAQFRHGRVTQTLYTDIMIQMQNTLSTNAMIQMQNIQNTLR